MSLQGSLETFALPDVLVLLSSTKKDGELRVVGGRVDGKIWLEKGQIVHTAVSGREAHAVDAVFELLRLESGTFNFDADGEPPHRAEPEPIDLVLADAQVRLGEWKEIAKVVPHLDAVIDMASEAPSDEVVVSRDHWRLLRSVAGGRSVHDLMDKLGLSEFDTCRTVKELVDANLASIDASAPASAKDAGHAASASPAAKAPKDTHREGTDDPDADERVEKAASKSASEAAKSELRDRESDSGPSTTARDELSELADLASRQPRKVRATTSGTTPIDEPASRPAATRPGAAPQVEEAKALVAQLAALSGDDEEAVAAKVTEHLASGGELPDVPEGDEPINRGLLLKFLSSVRN